MRALSSIRLTITVVLMLISLVGGKIYVQAAEVSKGSHYAGQIGERAKQIRERLRELREAARVHRQNVTWLHGKTGVVASGTGLDRDGKAIIKVFLEHKGVSDIPELLDGIQVRSQASGRIYALQHGITCNEDEGIYDPVKGEYGDGICETTERWPLRVPIGVSIGHPEITAGTIGARVTDNAIPPNVYILSNNHVLANSNSANLGDYALQPGPFDYGIDPDDSIGTLHDFQPIEFCECAFTWWGRCYGKTCPINTIDAAIASSTPDELGVSTPMGEFGSVVGYGVPSAHLHPAYGDPAVIEDENENLAGLVGTSVQKMGRTTGLTTGIVDAVHATVNVCYDQQCTKEARFDDQIVITPGDFSAGGDSGSLIVTNDAYRNPVGLLFAGSTTHTIANRIDLVLNWFGVTIDVNGIQNVAPTASFTAAPDSGEAPLEVSFTDTSVDSDGNVVAWSWDFGDGSTTSTLQNPSHTYTEAGTYTVTLTVTDNGGDTDTSSQDVTVTAPPALNVPPTASFTAAPDSGEAPLEVSFTDTSVDSDGNVVAWSWDFGDGSTTSTLQNPSHTYTEAGTYTVTLTVTDNRGDTDTSSQDVAVTAPPPSSWTELTFDDFESGWGNWKDGGSDAKLSSTNAIGSQALNLQDNSSTSESELAGSLDLTGYSKLKIEFSYVVQSFENSEDFWVRYSDNGGSTWHTLKAFVNNVDFVDDGTRYEPVITIDDGSYTFSNNVKIMFECDASSNRDDVYIDNVRISAW